MKNTIKVLVLFIAFISFNDLNAQKRNLTISGYVLDSDKAPVANTMIFIDGIKQKRVTDSKGYYTIKLRRVPKKLMFYSTKYGILDYPYSGKKKINITYNIPETKNSNQPKEIVRNPNNFRYRSIYDYLRGRVAGVYIKPDNSIIIRGNTSLKGSNQPLFVLNKIALSNKDDIESINPNDIKSVKVLKGADASQYGIRGAAGVIVITTY
jgi:TonB-dependent SusC/RagA subfamily outer membrane receptor